MTETERRLARIEAHLKRLNKLTEALCRGLGGPALKGLEKIVEQEGREKP
jgi:hypothetical protein